MSRAFVAEENWVQDMPREHQVADQATLKVEASAF